MAHTNGDLELTTDNFKILRTKGVVGHLNI